MKVIIFLLFIISFYPSYSQKWQNITHQSGAYGVKDIVEDSKGNLYLYSEKGIYSSSDNGKNWVKVGQNLFEEILQAIPNWERFYGNCKVVVARDSLFAELSDLPYGYSPYKYWKTLFFSKGSWKPYSKERTQQDPPATKYGVKAYVEEFVENYLVRKRILYSYDGGKNWNSKTLKYGSENAYLKLYKENYYLFDVDSVYRIENFPNWSKNKNEISNEESSNVFNEDLIRGYQFKDNIYFAKFDTLNLSWGGINNYIIPNYDLNKRYHVFVTNDNLFYCSYTVAGCQDEFKVSKDYGQIWKDFSLQPFELGIQLAGILGIKQFGTKTFIYSVNILLQSSVSSDSLAFKYTSPGSFGSQISNAYTISKNYIGNHLVIQNCANKPINNILKWDGIKWTAHKQAPVNKSFNTYNLRNFRKHHLITGNPKGLVLISSDEGASLKEIPIPFLSKDRNGITLNECGDKWYATSNTYNDSLLVSKDYGLNWTLKTIPKDVLTKEQQSYFKIQDLGCFQNELIVKREYKKASRIYSYTPLTDQWKDLTSNLGSVDLSYVTLRNPENTDTSLTFPINIIPYYTDSAYSLVNDQWKLFPNLSLISSHGLYSDTLLKFVRKEGESNFSFAKVYMKLGKSNWIKLRNNRGLNSSDTIFFNFTVNNRGLFASTNHGLLFSPYPSIITAIEESEVMSTNDTGYCIFPNPSINEFFIQAEENNLDFKILDLSGQILQVGQNWSTLNGISTVNLKKGAYLVKITGKKEQMVKYIKL